MTALSDYAENKLLDHLLRNSAFTQPAALYVALYTAAPSDSGGGTEVSGGSYARQTVAFAAASAGATDNSGAVSFTNMPACTVTHVGIFDASTGGNLLLHGALSSSQAVASGNTFTFAVGAIDVTLG